MEVLQVFGGWGMLKRRIGLRIGDGRKKRLDIFCWSMMIVQLPVIFNLVLHKNCCPVNCIFSSGWNFHFRRRLID